MASTRLVRKALRNRAVSRKRINAIKRLTTKPVIKNIDVEQIKEEFANKKSKPAAKKEDPVKEAAKTEVKAEKEEAHKAEQKESKTETATTEVKKDKKETKPKAESKPEAKQTPAKKAAPKTKKAAAAKAEKKEDTAD